MIRGKGDIRKEVVNERRRKIRKKLDGNQWRKETSRRKPRKGESEKKEGEERMRQGVKR